MCRGFKSLPRYQHNTAFSSKDQPLSLSKPWTPVRGFSLLGLFSGCDPRNPPGRIAPGFERPDALPSPSVSSPGDRAKPLRSRPGLPAGGAGAILRACPMTPTRPRSQRRSRSSTPSPTFRLTRATSCPRRPGGDLVVTVRLRADGGLVVSSPGMPPHRIVAVRAKRARAVGQRVAELVEEALQARDHVRQGPTSI